MNKVKYTALFYHVYAVKDGRLDYTGKLTSEKPNTRHRIDI